MPFQFNLAYLFGYTPWDRGGGKPLRQLRELFEGPKAIAPGSVLDLGCGMGRGTIYLAQLGWKATGIDAVGRALRVARRRAARAGVSVELVEGDITQLDRAGIVGERKIAASIDLVLYFVLLAATRWLMPVRHLPYSGTATPDPPNSAGKSFSLGSPSFMGNTVSA